MPTVVNHLPGAPLRVGLYAPGEAAWLTESLRVSAEDNDPSYERPGRCFSGLALGALGDRGNQIATMKP